MLDHQFLQGVVRIVIPACPVDVELHGNPVGLLEQDRPSQVLASRHAIFLFVLPAQLPYPQRTHPFRPPTTVLILISH
jgi:hypothetical protein